MKSQNFGLRTSLKHIHVNKNYSHNNILISTIIYVLKNVTEKNKEMFDIISKPHTSQCNTF